MATTPRKASAPRHRRLRVFAFDPGLDQQLQTADINELTLKLPWDGTLQPGPVDDYLEVVDVDPASNRCYAPVDLNDPDLLAQDGLPPSEGDPRFHQQMVYAVARTTIQHFEEALGRRALWSPRLYRNKQGKLDDEFVRRLRIYPHALREANAYYSPNKKALLFGYFPAADIDPGKILPGGLIFTCLSHDIIAHETTHALLDGMHRRFIEPSNVDALALHEAFADIVALFQHFSHPEVLHHEIASTGGRLEQQNLLAQLAWQFGQSIGCYGALRDALGKPDPQTHKWKLKQPDPTELGRTMEPHARGAILVAAVFDAYLSIYRRCTADLLRIASGGSGVLPAGQLHPDLVARLAEEAAKTARRVLRICIRALDYCPPVDVNFGDYLRALITADVDAVPDDRLRYRIAFVEAFRQRGIYPLDVRSLSEESLLWQPPTASEEQVAFEKALCELCLKCRLVPDWSMKSDRRAIYDNCETIQRKLRNWFFDPRRVQAMRAVGLNMNEDAPQSIYRPERPRDGRPALEVHSVRPAYRVGPDGDRITDIVIEMTQRRRGYLKHAEQLAADSGQVHDPPDFIFRGGCTLLVDVAKLYNGQDGVVRYFIGKNIESVKRLEVQRHFLSQPQSFSLWATYLGDPRLRLAARRDAEGKGAEIEHLALLNRGYTGWEVS